MEQFIVQGEVSRDGRLHLDLSCHLPPGPVEVKVVVRSAPTETAFPDWRELYGLGSEIWQGLEALEYIHDLRGDRERLNEWMQ